MTSVFTVAIIAKECLPGRVKTRLAVDVGDEAAARLASASLADTMAAVASFDVARRILFFEGQPPAGAARAGFEVLRQPGGGLDERLGYLFDTIDGPLLLIGMDTPQLTAHDLREPLGRGGRDVDAWFGPAADGGFWSLGMRHPDGSLLRGVPMSHPDTGRVQRARLVDAGMTVAQMPTLCDVDWIDDARAVAADAPSTRFAREWRRLRGSDELTASRGHDGAHPTRDT